MKRLVIGILAHVDSGKTTLSEAMLYSAGEIRKLGRVDHKNAFLDTYPLERDRGITIFAKQAMLRLENAEYTLLDTPGHIDFSTEMERALQVLDYAILIISSTAGVQSHTETLWRLLIRYNIPTFIFINKMDMCEKGEKTLIDELKKSLDNGCIDFSNKNTNEFFENAAMCDENLMEEFLETSELKTENIVKLISERKIFPCYFGSALKFKGIDDFLKGLESYTQSYYYSNEFGAKVFKIATDEQGNRLTYMKIVGGKLRVRTILNGNNSEVGEWQEKVTQIRIYSGSKFQVVEEASAGTVCAVIGLNYTYTGEGLGSEKNSEIPVLEPILTYRIKLPEKMDIHMGLIRLRKLEEEEPQLHIIWNEQLKEIHAQLMGEVQIEILKSIILERFDMEVEFVQGGFAYKETIIDSVEGVGHYEPLRHYAEVHLLLESGERGSGLKFYTNCREDTLNKNWQNLILTHLKEKSHIGVLTGSPITDMKITLMSGKAHIKHTEGGDFRQATYRAVRNGLKQAKSILLEPWYNFRLEVPTENVGRAMSDLQKMDGNFSMPETINEMSIISGSVAAVCIQQYQTDVNSYTKGRGKLTYSLKGYEPCHNQEEVINSIDYDSESDIANSADSVFCTHGSSFIVKWDEVYKYMHLPSIFDETAETELEVYKPYKNYKLDSGLSFSDDKELVEIFERTYGSIKRDPRSAFKRVKKTDLEVDYSNIKSLPDNSTEYLLVDGYNIIFAWDDLKALARDNLDLARSKLINILCNYQAFRQCELILVFDAYKLKNNEGSIEKINNINVVYTKESETADMYIEKVTHKLGKKYRVCVATSDNIEQIIIMGQGAYRISAREFQMEVARIENEMRKFIKNFN